MNPLIVLVGLILLFGGFGVKTVLDNKNRIIMEIKTEALAQGVDQALCLAIAQQESGFQSLYASDYATTGSFGIFQMTRSTGTDYGVVPDVDFQPPAGELKDIQTGIKHIKRLFTYYGGDETKVIAAFNHGQGTVDQGKVNLETDSYVVKVSGYYQDWEATV